MTLEQNGFYGMLGSWGGDFDGDYIRAGYRAGNLGLEFDAYYNYSNRELIEFFGAGTGIDGSIGNQVTLQAIGIGVTIAYTGVLSWIILRIVGALIGLQVSEEAESEGLDIALHQESGYNL